MSVCFYTFFNFLAVMASAVSIGTSAYFVYCKYISRNIKNVSIYDYVYQAKSC